MKTIKYLNFKFTLTWDTYGNYTTWIAFGTINGLFLLVHTGVSEQACITKMEGEIDEKVVAHQI
jgi:hypothetical protein